MFNSGDVVFGAVSNRFVKGDYSAVKTTAVVIGVAIIICGIVTLVSLIQINRGIQMTKQRRTKY